MQMSTTYVSALVGLVSVIAPLFGFEVVSETFTKTVADIVAIGSLVYVFYGRFRAGGVSALGFRKKVA